jgi:hypothetical protein
MLGGLIRQLTCEQLCLGKSVTPVELSKPVELESRRFTP